MKEQFSKVRRKEELLDRTSWASGHFNRSLNLITKSLSTGGEDMCTVAMWSSVVEEGMLLDI